MLAEAAAEPDDGTTGADFCVTTVNVGTGEHLNQMFNYGRCNIQDVFELLAESSMPNRHARWTSSSARVPYQPST